MILWNNPQTKTKYRFCCLVSWIGFVVQSIRSYTREELRLCGWEWGYRQGRGRRKVEDQDHCILRQPAVKSPLHIWPCAQHLSTSLSLQASLCHGRGATVAILQEKAQSQSVGLPVLRRLAEAWQGTAFRCRKPEVSVWTAGHCSLPEGATNLSSSLFILCMVTVLLLTSIQGYFNIALQRQRFGMLHLSFCP